MKFSPRHSLCLIALIAGLPAPLQAGGSISSSDLKSLLSVDDPITVYVRQSLDIAPTGGATRIGQAVNPNLGGQRVGPYTFPARRSGNSGDYNLIVTLKTSVKWLDDSGNVVDVGKATKFTEKLTGVEVAPMAKAPVEPTPAKPAAPAEPTLAEKQAALMKKIVPQIDQVNNISLTPKGLPVSVKINIKAAAFDKIKAGKMPTTAEINDAIGQLKGKQVTIPSGSDNEKKVTTLIQQLRELDTLR